MLFLLACAACWVVSLGVVAYHYPASEKRFLGYLLVTAAEAFIWGAFRLQS